MRVIIVGNGLAGIICAKTLRELDKKVEIEVFAEEKYHYYPRPNLIEFLAGTIPFERMFAFPQEWYREQNINIHLEKPVIRIFPDSQEIEVEGGKREKYESLLAANGSFSFIPPFKGTDKKGIFALRTLDDAFELLEYLKNHQRVIVIGGGLLGLETARAMKSRGARVEVVEFFDRLLPRQLDIQGASLLKAQIENMGIKVYLGLATEEVLGQDEVRGLRFKGEREIETDMAIVAAGVRPNLRLVKEAGLETDRGLVVDDYLQSSNPKIFGAGDLIQHRGKVYGIIPSSFNQARIVASNILGKKEKYEGTVPSNTLKVVGLDLTSVGLVNPEEGTCEEFRKEKKEEGIYKKIVIQNGAVVGAIWMGTKKGVSEINRIISQKINVEKHKISLLEDDFDYSVL
ncbi:MAG: FAD-dependent oxidoreductase [Candidatus Aminicenantes bacterium]|nr:FAD-dependent oxidoreductase [Candidatus Aminicenantes bacterium]